MKMLLILELMQNGYTITCMVEKTVLMEYLAIGHQRLMLTMLYLFGRCLEVVKYLQVPILQVVLAFALL